LPKSNEDVNGARASLSRGIDQGFIKPEFLDLWYPAPDIDALLRYLEGYEPHADGLKWTRRTRR
jgi:hypothetical protein